MDKDVDMLPKVELGRTGLMVTRLGYGALELRDVQSNGGRLPNEEHAGRVLNAVLDAGINFIDTAPSYGRSEEFIGRFASHRRSEFYLETKGGRQWRDNPPGGSEWSREALMDSMDQSLRRLQTDYVDAFMLHGPKVNTIETYDCVTTLKDIQAQGKARFIGASAVLPDIATLVEWGVFDVFQVVYSALEPEHEDVITRAAQLGAGTVIRGGASKGAPVREQGRGLEFPTVRQRWVESGLEGALSPERAVETLFRYVLNHDSVHTVIVGTQNLEHLAANVAATEKGPLEQETYNLVRERVHAVVR